ncbi:MAG TPA: flippase activity-associated protein Agl23 [Pyrinomonadaceae bacterium]|nr:flippase activity-associated protein Agl23 [Pyrinomonadaceae bacterium]
MDERTWFIAVTAIMLLAAILRLYDLNLVPLHHDEGVNGNFLVRLVRDGYYHYDPANYHGPTLYYFAAVLAWILRPFVGVNASLTTIGIRLVPALFGLATIALVLTLRRNLGTIATLSAAFFLAISPGAVYLSRYFIHETLFVFFTLGLVVALLKYYEDLNPAYLILAAISAALLFATKETAMISVGVLVIALGVTQVYRLLWRSIGGTTNQKKRRTGDNRTFFEKVGGSSKLTVWVVIGLAVFVSVYVLFYSSFFTNYPQGVYDSLKTFQIWTKTGQEAHKHPPATYIWWLLEQESPLLVLGALGAIVAVLKPTKSFALFSALWAFGLLAAYSLIAYKTPWLALNFIVPLALTSGVAIEWFYKELARWQLSKHLRWYAVAGLLLVAIGPLAGMARIFDEVAWEVSSDTFKDLISVPMRWKTFIPGYQTIDLNFLNYDNDNRYYVYVYAHTRRETLKLLDEIGKVAERTHQGKDTGITIVSADYWPLPWYLRDYKRVGYHGHMTPSTEPIIIARQDQAGEVETTFGDRYQQIQSGFNPAGSFPLRPGVDLLLYARRELVP